MQSGELASRVVAAVCDWVGIYVGSRRFGGEEFRWGRVEIGHVHYQGFVDVPFSRKIRDQLLASGLAKQHHVLPDSGWVTLPLKTEDDVKRAVELLRLSFDLKRARRDADPGRRAALEAGLRKFGLLM
jgi:hypothetical protein